MKKSQFIIIQSLFLTSSLMIYASTISYNKDGSITKTDTNGNKTIIKMDGKTPEGESIPDDVKKIKISNTQIEIIYSGAMSDMPLSFYKDDGYIKKFIKSLLKETSEKLSGKKISAKNISIVISNCRIGKTGYCGRMNRTDVNLTVYKDSEVIEEIQLNHSNLLGRNNYATAAKVCADKIFSKL